MAPVGAPAVAAAGSLAGTAAGSTAGTAAAGTSTGAAACRALAVVVRAEYVRGGVGTTVPATLTAAGPEGRARMWTVTTRSCAAGPVGVMWTTTPSIPAKADEKAVTVTGASAGVMVTSTPLGYRCLPAKNSENAGVSGLTRMRSAIA